MEDKGRVSLSEGSGGRDMVELIKTFRYTNRGRWRNFDNDSATLDIGGGRILAYTTDSYVVSPIFFPGGDIGHIAACGTINDLAVLGARPLGLSVSFVLEEGLPKEDLNAIVASIDRVSGETGVPIVTGDTKVMEKGKVDKIIVNTSGVGMAKKGELLTRRPKRGDKVLLSGGLGEHAVALLSKRFDFETGIKTDSKPLLDEIAAVKGRIRLAKDVTRGGLAAVANEICGRHNVGMLLSEEDIPVKREVLRVTEMLGVDVLELACEGRFLCVAEAGEASSVERRLRSFNGDAKIIGEVTGGKEVVVQTYLGRRALPMPSGRIVPRIC